MNRILNRVLQLTEEMLSAANSNDWELLAELQNAREVLITQLSENTSEISYEHSNQARKLIGEIKLIDEQIRELVETNKQETLKKSKLQNQSQKAIRAYKGL